MGLVDFYRDHIIDSGRQAAFLLVLAFLITFVLTRMYTRLARTRGWGSGSVGDVHLHHMVVGVVLILFSGFLDFALDPGHPWLDLLAICFGAGAALTLDEFALWLHLRDVYWAEEGRSSLDAVILATLFAALVFLGVAPFGLEERASTAATAVTIALVLLTSSISFLKGKLLMGLAGIFIPLVGLIGAIRLARPQSPWARRWYRADGRKLAKAREREKKRSARKRWIRDLIGGAPGLPPAA